MDVISVDTETDATGGREASPVVIAPPESEDSGDAPLCVRPFTAAT
jgi:hypothetical protein